MFYKRLHKKGVSELVSFVLITLLVVVASSSTYYLVNGYFDEKVILLDEERGENVIKKLSVEMNKIQQFDSQTSFVSFNFRKGQLIFSDDTVSYQSLSKYLGDTFCLEGICQESVGGYLKISHSLNSPYTFQENFTLVPGEYFLVFKHIKNESKISVTLK